MEGTTVADFVATATTFLGLPTDFVGAVTTPPASSVRACCSLAMLRSILSSISEIAMHYSPWFMQLVHSLHGKVKTLHIVSQLLYRYDT